MCFNIRQRPQRNLVAGVVREMGGDLLRYSMGLAEMQPNAFACESRIRSRMRIRCRHISEPKPPAIHTVVRWQKQDVENSHREAPGRIVPTIPDLRYRSGSAFESESCPLAVELRPASALHITAT